MIYELMALGTCVVIHKSTVQPLTHKVMAALHSHATDRVDIMWDRQTNGQTLDHCFTLTTADVTHVIIRMASHDTFLLFIFLTPEK